MSSILQRSAFADAARGELQPGERQDEKITLNRAQEFPP